MATTVLETNIALQSGTFFTEPANVSHFGVTKAEGAILYFYGVGPSGITRLE